MMLLRLIATAMVPLASLLGTVAGAANLYADKSAGRALTSVERAYVESLLNVKRIDTPDSPKLEARQDITTDLSKLLDLIGSLGEFLTPAFLNDTYSVVVNLADLLADPFVSDTRGIITQASGLLTSLTPLLDEITSIDLGGIVTSISPLLTSDSINGISTLLTNAENLLTANFVTELTTLINAVAPVNCFFSLCPLTRQRFFKSTDHNFQLVSAVASFITALLSALLGG